MISIIIPTTGSVFSVKRICDSILNQIVAEEIEVCIVANPDSAKIRKLISSYPSYFHYFSSETGANKARNQGIQNSYGRILFFFDDDCVLSSCTFIKDSVGFLDAHPEYMGMGGPYRSLGQPRSVYGCSYYYLQNKWLFEGAHESGSACYLVGGNMALRREVFESYGRFSEELNFGGTETEFFGRLKNELLAFNKEHFLWHDYNLSKAQLMRKAFLQGIGSRYIQFRHPNRRRPAITFGEQALLQEIGLASVPEEGLQLYKRSFHAGEKYYDLYRRPQVSKWKVRIENLKVSMRICFNSLTRLLDETIYLLENLRSLHESHSSQTNALSQNDTKNKSSASRAD